MRVKHKDGHDCRIHQVWEESPSCYITIDNQLLYKAFYTPVVVEEWRDVTSECEVMGFKHEPSEPGSPSGYDDSQYVVHNIANRIMGPKRLAKLICGGQYRLLRINTIGAVPCTAFIIQEKVSP